MKNGIIPPQAIELEHAVIGALLIDSHCITEIADALRPEMFYKQAHGIIYEAIYDLYQRTQPIDLLTVSAQLKQMEKLEVIGGDFYLIELTKSIASSAHIEFHTRIIIQKYIRRQIISKFEELRNHAYKDDNDIFDVLDMAYNTINGISEVSVKPREVQIGKIMKAEVEKKHLMFLGKSSPGIKTPIRDLTDKTGGWRPSELIIIAGRPGMGKTAMALLFALDPAKGGVPVGFFSLEMSKEQLADRLLSMEGQISGRKFTIQGLDTNDVSRLNNLDMEIPLIVDDSASLSIEELQIKAKRMKAKHGIQMLIVDYMQLMRGNAGKGNREQEISKISRGLKLIAKDLNIPVIALSQLSRAVETRGGSKRPLLSDLRESGAIEQDADMVIFLYRPEYYNIAEWDDYNHAPTAGEAEYIVAKNRNGGLTRNRMRFIAEYTLFSDIENYHPVETENYYEKDNLPF